jgi:hypothetical protein
MYPNNVRRMLMQRSTPHPEIKKTPRGGMKIYLVSFEDWRWGVTVMITTRRADALDMTAAFDELFSLWICLSVLGLT